MPRRGEKRLLARGHLGASKAAEFTSVFPGNTGAAKVRRTRRGKSVPRTKPKRISEGDSDTGAPLQPPKLPKRVSKGRQPLGPSLMVREGLGGMRPMG
ncbi:hypothetical protein EJP82_20410 [Paenibacillus anaericanus]|uniref:Uncharacterized protein n=1 Tax=Paenibacillus anaericanus TaxID=170367 RepID=A0A433Y4S6_9BACL|nr:hypothetical protein EJP82_20410 [Paenibacillus anaericanus]